MTLLTKRLRTQATITGEDFHRILRSWGCSARTFGKHTDTVVALLAATFEAGAEWALYHSRHRQRRRRP